MAVNDRPSSCSEGAGKGGGGGADRLSRIGEDALEARSPLLCEGSSSRTDGLLGDADAD